MVTDESYRFSDGGEVLSGEAEQDVGLAVLRLIPRRKQILHRGGVFAARHLAGAVARHSRIDAFERQSNGLEAALVKYTGAFCVYLAYMEAVGGMEAQPAAPARHDLAAQRIKEFFFIQQQRVVVEGEVFCAQGGLEADLAQDLFEASPVVSRPQDV